MAYCSVSDFYAGKTLMITGATGFIGKVLLEKLLRCCPDIKKIFLLVRTKRDKGAAARIKEITSGIVAQPPMGLQYCLAVVIWRILRPVRSWNFQTFIIDVFVQIHSMLSSLPLWVAVIANVLDCLQKFPLEKGIGRPMVQLTKYAVVFECMNMINGKIPAFFIDCALKLTRQKPMMMKMNQRIVKLVYVLRPFLLNSWDFSHHNIEALSAAMNEKDREVFFTDVSTLDWPSYMKAHVIGVKRYMLNEDMENLPAAHGHQRMLRNLRWAFNTVLAVVIWRILMTRSKVARNFRTFIIDVLFRFIRCCRMLITSMGSCH
nr:fatty acyl-CoA reductase 1-like [Lytechinus pictus]